MKKNEKIWESIIWLVMMLVTVILIVGNPDKWYIPLGIFTAITIARTIYKINGDEFE